MPGTTGFTLTTAGSADQNTNIVTINNKTYRTINIINKGWTVIDHDSTNGTDYINA